MTTLYARSFDTEDDHRKYSFLWDTYGTPFVIDNSVKAIICNYSIIFTVPLVYRSVTLEIA